MGKVSDLLEARKTKQQYTFEQWLGFLDGVALTYGFQGRVVSQTGEECWREYYDDGRTPLSAFMEDLSYAC